MITLLSCSLLIWLTAASFGLPVKFPFWMLHVFLSAVFIALANSNAFLWSKRHSAAIDVEFFHHLLQSISYHILHLIPKITMLQSDRHHSATYCWIDSPSFMKATVKLGIVNCSQWSWVSVIFTMFTSSVKILSFGFPGDTELLISL